MKRLTILLLSVTLFLLGCTEITYKEGSATVGDQTAIVAGSEVQSFDAESGKLVLSGDYSDSKYLVIGDGANIKGGRLVKVVSTDGSTYNVQDAQFNEAVKDANLQTSLVLSEDQVESATPLTRGVYLSKSFTINVGKNLLEYADKDDADFNVSDYLSTSIEGKIVIAPTVDIDMSIKNFELEQFKLALSANIDADLSLALSAKYQYNKYIALYKFNYSVITIMAGPVPIVIQPIIEVGLELGFEAKVTAKITFQEHIDFSVYAIKEGTLPWATNADFNAEKPKFENFAATVNVNGKVAFKEKVGLMLYGLIGANLDASQFVKAAYEGEFVVETIEEFKTANFDQKLSAEFGLGFGINIRVSAFSFVDKDIQVYGKDITLARYDWDCKPNNNGTWSGLIPDAINK